MSTDLEARVVAALERIAEVLATRSTESGHDDRRGEAEGPEGQGLLLLDGEALAKLFKVSVRKLQRLDDGGEIPQAIMLGKAKRWPTEEIREWIRAGAPPRKQWLGTRRSAR